MTSYRGRSVDFIKVNDEFAFASKNPAPDPRVPKGFPN